MSTKTIAISDWIEEEEIFQRLERQSHITTEENKEAKTGEIGEETTQRGETDKSVKRKLAQDDSDIKNENVENKEVFFGEFFVSVKSERDKNDEDEETDEFCKIIVAIFAVEKAVVEAPEDGRSESDFNVLPS